MAGLCEGGNEPLGPLKAMKKFRTTGSVLDKKRTCVKHVLTMEMLDEISHRLEIDPAYCYEMKLQTSVMSRLLEMKYELVIVLPEKPNAPRTLTGPYLEISMAWTRSGLSANDDSGYNSSANDKSALYRYKTASIDYSRICNRKRISEKSRRLEIQYCRRRFIDSRLDDKSFSTE
ncbi:hypothetical protein ANN_25165 [Periplaneta americana]|uniref:Uncharacterized protein n=1 Tax=Periplaneta americana TaxID=6978 RepID=A0ABQ8S0T2_PERAM|nr:hypothetical protein ANN_25165 [Periplaneta americana]